MKTVDENLHHYIEQERMYHFEGERGVRHLETIVGILGYDQFMGQSEILTFLTDNPGAQEALINWIGDQRSDEWNTNLEGQLEAVEDSDTDEDGEQGACIITGADGEDPDDCTTHDHEDV